MMTQCVDKNIVTNRAALTAIAMLLLVLSIGSTSAAQTQNKHIPTGYTDTPFLPGEKWRVHDINRPRPAIVSPGSGYGTPPSDAIILFDGDDFSKWTGDHNRAVDWRIEDGAMIVPVRPEGSDPVNLFSKRTFGDVQLHVEWRTPAKPVSNSQGRGNSGIFFMEKYEVQVLDSYENITYADGQASALYGWMPPKVNASRGPGEWQSYDIIFEAPKFGAAGALIEPAYVTVLHNGILTHHRQKFLGPTAHKVVAEYVAHEPKGRIVLQDHGDPVSFRNIWVRELGLNELGPAP